MNETADRRRFRRAAFQADVQLVDAAGALPAELVDISLKGALVNVPARWRGKAGLVARLELRLADDTEISMATVVSHVEGSRVGLRCIDIDLDSITHLRRLVELNAGDPALLDRELAALVADRD
jgi:hypothetical protein